MKTLFSILVVFVSLHLDAQKLVLDSSLNHFYVFKEKGSYKHPKTQFTEYLNDKILSRGHLKFSINEYNSNVIKNGSIHQFKYLFIDTFVEFDLNGDTIQLQFHDKHHLKISIDYYKNKRISITNYKKGRITSSINYTPNGYLAFQYRKGRRLGYSSIIKKDSNQITAFTYRKKFATAPYYNKTSRTYCNFEQYYQFILDTSYFIYQTNHKTYIAKKLKYNIQTIEFKRNRFNFNVRKSTKKKFKEYKKYQILHSIDSNQNTYQKIQYESKNTPYISISRTVNNKYFNFYKSTKSIHFETYRRFKDTLTYVLNYTDSSSVICNKETYTYFRISKIKHDTFLYKGQGNHEGCYIKTYKNNRLIKTSFLEYPIHAKKRHNHILYSDIDIAQLLRANSTIYPSDTIYYSNDSTIIFTVDAQILKVKNQQKTLFHANNPWYKIAKDQLNCGTGLKDTLGNWIIPAKYDHIINTIISEYNYQFNGYYASINEYGTILDDHGNTLIPLTKGLSQNYIHLNSLGIPSIQYINSLGFICNDIQSDSFKIVNIFNETVLKGEGKFEYLTLSDDPNAGYYTIKSSKNQSIYCKNKVLLSCKKIVPTTYLNNATLFRITSDTNNSDTLALLRYEGEYLPVKLYNKMDQLIGRNDFDIIGYQLFNNQEQLFFTNDTIYQSKMENPFLLEYAENTIIIKHNGLYGIINRSGELTIPIKYTSIFFGPSLFFCVKDTLVDIYNQYGKYFNQLSQLSFAGYKPFVTMYDNSLYPQYYNTSTPQFTIVTKNKKLGIVNNLNGRLVLDCLYDEIDNNVSSNQSLNKRNYSKFNQEIKVVCKRNGKVIVLEYINDTFIQVDNKFPIIYQSKTNKNQSLIDTNGASLVENKLIFYQTSKHNKNVGYFLIYETDSFNSNNLKLIQKRDYQGHVIFDLKQYKSISFRDNVYYVQNTENKCGILDENLNPIVPIKYSHISLDVRNGLFWYKYNKNELWKLCKTNNFDVAIDSFDYPVKFEHYQYSLIYQNGYLGIINKEGHTIIKPQFDQYKPERDMFYPFPAIAIKDKNLYSINISGNISQLPHNFNNYYQSNQNLIKLTHHNQSVYLFDDYFGIFDSSNALFLNSSTTTRSKFLKYSNNGFHDSSKIIKENKTIIATLFNSFKYPISFNRFYTQIDINFQFPENSYPSSNPKTFTIQTPKEQPIHISSDTLSIFDLENSNNYYSFLESRNTLSYINSSNVLNLYFDKSSNFVLKFDLTSIIEPSKMGEFVSFLTSKWLTIDDPRVPCVPKDKILEYFNTNFILHYNSIIFGTEHIFRMPIDDIRPFLKPEWKDRL